MMQIDINQNICHSSFNWIETVYNNTLRNVLFCDALLNKKQLKLS